MLGGTTIGSIVVEEKIASGASGEIFLGRQPGLDRRVVLRKLRRDLLAGGPVVERFWREARLSARVRHANVVQIFDFFAERGDHYLVMEHVDGPTLRSVLDDGRRIPSRVALRVGLEVARGLEEIQRRGIVHADVHPGNILISRWGEVKLTGLAQAHEAGETDPPAPPEITAYTAPELRTESRVDGRTDVYGLAVLLCELLGGDPRERGLTRVSAARPRLAHVLRRCLREDLESRPGLADLRGRLERSLGRGAPDPRIEIAAWLWEARRMRPEEPASIEEGPGAGERLPGAVRKRWPGVVWKRWPGALWRPLSSGTRGLARRLRGLTPALPVTAAVATLALVAGALLLGSLREAPHASRAGIEPLPPVSARPPHEAPAPPAPAAEPASVSFVVIPWAEIQLGDREPFLTPRAMPLELPPGEYDLVLRHPRFGEVHRTLALRAGEQYVVRHIFERVAP